VYDADGGTSVNWGSASNAWDSTNDTYASKDIPRRQARMNQANYLLANSNKAPSLSYTITGVEIGIKGYVQRNTANMTVHLVPVFGGSTDGASSYSIAGSSLGTVRLGKFLL
jgi:hypothetical protein